MSKRGRKRFATSPSSAYKSTTFSTGSSYGDEWAAISQEVRKRDNYTCHAHVIDLPRCGNVYRPPFHHLLHVHHIIPFAKCKSHNKRNLITLCKDCHSKEHGRSLGKAISVKQKSAAAWWR